MPKVSVYLPDDLYQAARDEGLPISTLTQDAIRGALATKANAAWIEEMRHRAPIVSRPVDTSALMAEVRDEFGE